MTNIKHVAAIGGSFRQHGVSGTQWQSYVNETTGSRK